MPVRDLPNTTCQAESSRNVIMANNKLSGKTRANYKSALVKPDVTNVIYKQQVSGFNTKEHWAVRYLT